MSNDALPVSVAFWDYDRTLPIADGRVPMPGCRLCCTILAPHELFPRAFGSAEFDVSELSLSRHAQAVAAGSSRYTGLPVFLSRAFRHAAIYVRAGIERPGDLQGGRIGLRNYDDTAAVVARGLLRDQYGVSDAVWVIGPMEPGGGALVPLPELHAPAMVERLREGLTLDGELRAGRLDAVIALNPPPSLHSAPGRVRRLFPDYRAAEQAYARQTGLFPIMHLVGVRSSLLEAQPWLAGSVMRAFSAAKALATAGLGTLQAAKATLPWAVAEQAATVAVLGADYWPYGIEPNRRILEVTLRHLLDDGLLARALAPDDLFAPSEALA